MFDSLYAPIVTNLIYSFNTYSFFITNSFKCSTLSIFNLSAMSQPNLWVGYDMHILLKFLICSNAAVLPIPVGAIIICISLSLLLKASTKLVLKYFSAYSISQTGTLAY